ncbi:TonB-dependent receptor plug domain-containing protein [Sphingomonas montana]|uniref:TonB-dependent receptor plug domain-containing protein n=1 Tax=Sphingomonas montana TaxID=1843236 RepID=UPI00096C699F|nr:TonB-dependent receptor [Sphingomonas montana]
MRSGTATIALAFAMMSSAAYSQATPPDVQAAAGRSTATTPGGDCDPSTGANCAPAGQVTAGDDSIIVTGSRIQSPLATSVSPVQVIGAQAIQQAGVTNVQEILLENPAFGSPTLARTNTAFLTSGTGAATVDLRNLGTDRTLVLINGRRVVAGLPGSATVDLNMIPAQFLQRVDILTGGASSLYGSDAVAGVVNMIYKDNFEGLDANAQYNITQRGDTPGYQANITAGGNFAEDRGNIMVHFGYTREGQLLSSQRSNTRLDDTDRFSLTGDPADFGIPNEGTLSGLPPQGVFTSGGCAFTFSPTNLLERGFSANGGNISAASANACGVPAGTALPARGFNRQAFRTIAVPVRRYLLATRAKYDITDDVKFFAEGTYSRTSSARQIEPFGISTSGTTGIYPAGGLMPIQTRVRNADGTTTIVNNPFVPAGIFNASVDGDNDGLRDIAFSRRLTEFGPRSGSTDRDTFRIVAGLEGDFLDDKFHWDMSYNYGRTSEAQESSGQVNILNFRNALAVVPAGTIAGTIGPQCADANARANGCVPVNVFGNGTIDPAAVNFIQAGQTLRTRIQQQVVQANVSGSLFDLPAGPLGVAIGAEYRKEKSADNNDSLTNQGLNGGNALPDTAGSFNVKEVYGEINIPLIHDTPFIKQFNLRGAGRISDYSTVGTVYSYSAGAEWTIVDDLRLTGTYARAVRAPNVGELFQGPAQTFPTGLVDPCIGVTATSAGTLGEICRAAGGVNANIGANGAFAATQSDRQGISGFNRGNPNLAEEKSDSYTIGAILNPRSIEALRNLTLRVDYYNIKINDAIVGVPRQFILNKCYQEGDQSFCQFIRRRAQATALNSAGSLEFIDQAAVNGGALASEGIDFTVNYSLPLAETIGLPGAVNFRGTYTRLLKAYTVPVPGDPTRDNFKNEVGAARDRFTTSLGYSSNKVDVNFTGTYYGRSYEDDQLLAAYDLGPKDISVAPEFYLDAQARFKASDHYELYVGVDNMLDNNAPNLLTGTSFNNTGTDTAAGVYDVFGRRFYAGARLRF